MRKKKILPHATELYKDFEQALTPGESLLPSANIGPICQFNAEGKEKIHKDRPIETAYRQREWNWTEYHGRYNPVERSEIVDVPYKRYPRTQIPPPSVELIIVMPKDGMKYVVTPVSVMGKTSEEDIVHTINLILEIFGHCVVLTHEIEAISMPQIRRVHWEILPPGTHPWPHIKQKVQDVLNATNDQKKVVVEHRLETINAYAPEFVAVGHAGFSGYLVFGIPRARSLCAGEHPDRKCNLCVYQSMGGAVDENQGRDIAWQFAGRSYHSQKGMGFPRR